jgi:hypothetical protein
MMKPPAIALNGMCGGDGRGWPNQCAEFTIVTTNICLKNEKH